MEYSVIPAGVGVELRDYEHAFLLRRIADPVTGQYPDTKRMLDLRPGYNYKRRERSYEDEFIEPYMGKIYRGKAGEILTMGMEYVFGPEHADVEWDDEEYRHFIIGLLATVRHEP
jgi:hypothetical protein